MKICITSFEECLTSEEGAGRTLSSYLQERLSRNKVWLVNMETCICMSWDLHLLSQKLPDMSFFSWCHFKIKFPSTWHPLQELLCCKENIVSDNVSFIMTLPFIPAIILYLWILTKHETVANVSMNCTYWGNMSFKSIRALLVLSMFTVGPGGLAVNEAACCGQDGGLMLAHTWLHCLAKSCSSSHTSEMSNAAILYRGHTSSTRIHNFFFNTC